MSRTILMHKPINLRSCTKHVTACPHVLSPARPPESPAELGLGKTPGNEASVRISNDLVREVQQKSAQARRMFGYPLGHIESSSMTSSTIPTPPSLFRCTRHGMDNDDSISADSDSDSLDEVHNTAHPSAAFLNAKQAPVIPSGHLTIRTTRLLRRKLRT